MSTVRKPRFFGDFARSALDLLLPPRCAGTGEVVDAPGMISPAFWSQLGFIEAPFCDVCGIPFSFDAPAGSLCASCIETEPVFDQARAAVTYNDASRDLLLAFKYGDRLHAVDTFVPWMMRAGTDMISACDIIIPVPLHASRLWRRRFNQSALLASAISKRSGKLHIPDAMIRARKTTPQKGLSRKERRENVRGAFTVNPRFNRDLTDKNVLLIDDVFTSGATLNECARALKDVDISRVYVLTVARVTIEEF